MSLFGRLVSVDCQDCAWRRCGLLASQYALILAAREHTTKTDGHLVVFSEQS